MREALCSARAVRLREATREGALCGAVGAWRRRRVAALLEGSELVGRIVQTRRRGKSRVETLLAIESLGSAKGWLSARLLDLAPHRRPILHAAACADCVRCVRHRISRRWISVACGVRCAQRQPVLHRKSSLGCVECAGFCRRGSAGAPQAGRHESPARAAGFGPATPRAPDLAAFGTATSSSRGGSKGESTPADVPAEHVAAQADSSDELLGKDTVTRRNSDTPPSRRR